MISINKRSKMSYKINKISLNNYTIKSLNKYCISIVIEI